MRGSVCPCGPQTGRGVAQSKTTNHMGREAIYSDVERHFTGVGCRQASVGEVRSIFALLRNVAVLDVRLGSCKGGSKRSRSGREKRGGRGSRSNVPSLACNLLSGLGRSPSLPTVARRAGLSGNKPLAPWTVVSASS